MSTAATITPAYVESEQSSVDDFDVEHFEGWYCIRTDDWACPGQNCTFTASFITAMHLIVVWPAMDDKSLLAQAHNAKEAGRNPKIVEYREEYGPAMTFDEWIRNGKPVHGQRPEPDNWQSISRKRL